jgi:hypothetical protein
VLAPDAGEVRWRGRLMDDEIRRRIGYLPEDHGQTFSPLFARWKAATSTRSTQGGGGPGRTSIGDFIVREEGVGVGMAVVIAEPAPGRMQLVGMWVD